MEEQIKHIACYIKQKQKNYFLNVTYKHHKKITKRNSYTVMICKMK